MGEQRGFAPLLTVDLASVTVELNLCESGARFPCKWSSVLEIYIFSIQFLNSAIKIAYPENVSLMDVFTYNFNTYSNVFLCYLPLL